MSLGFLDPLGITYIRLAMLLPYAWNVVQQNWDTTSLQRTEHRGMAKGYWKVVTGQFKLTRSMLGQRLDLANAIAVLIILERVRDIIEAVTK